MSAFFATRRVHLARREGIVVLPRTLLPLKLPDGPRAANGPRQENSR